MKKTERRSPKYQYNLTHSINAITAHRNYRDKVQTMTLARNISQQNTHFRNLICDNDDTDENHPIHTPISSQYQASVLVKTSCSSPLPNTNYTPKHQTLYLPPYNDSANKRNQAIEQSYTTTRPFKNAVHTHQTPKTTDKTKDLHYLLNQIISKGDSSSVIADDEEEGNRLRAEKKQIKCLIEKLSILLRDRIRRNTNLRSELNYILGLK